MSSYFFKIIKLHFILKFNVNFLNFFHFRQLHHSNARIFSTKRVHSKEPPSSMLNTGGEREKKVNKYDVKMCKFNNFSTLHHIKNFSFHCTTLNSHLNRYELHFGAEHVVFFVQQSFELNAPTAITMKLFFITTKKIVECAIEEVEVKFIIELHVI